MTSLTVSPILAAQPAQRVASCSLKGALMS